MQFYLKIIQHLSI